MIRILATVTLSALLAPVAWAGDSFSLSATSRDFARYYPTYLANGYWSVASSVLGTDATAAQMMGVMDYTPDDVSRPAAIPSWNEIDYSGGAGWLNDTAPDPRSHGRYRQTLDMHEGLLRTRYVWRDHARRTDVSVTSFVSQSNPHLGSVSLLLTPRFSGRIHLRFTLRAPAAPQRLPLATLDARQFAAVSSATNPDQAAGGNRSAIWYRGQVAITGAGGDADERTLRIEARAIGGRSVRLSAAVELPPALQNVQVRATHDRTSTLLEVDGDVRSGRSYRFTKFVAASADSWSGTPGPDDTPPPDAAIRARSRGLDALQSAHVAAWHALWRSDIRVGGNPVLQRTIHSDLFYLLENTAPGTSWPAAACGFSANYFGHVFWDNDFWVLPPLLMLHPARARSLLAFRERTLPQARARAAAHGFDGAMYPWEADPGTGEDVTPRFAIENADREIHVNGAVALAQWQYYLAGGDRAYLRESAYPIIRAVADFWVSRAARHAATRGFDLLDVTSPEEDYTHVDNELYTNAVARRSLEAAVAAADVLGETADPRWSAMAAGLSAPKAVDGRFHDFDPSMPHDKTTSWMATSVPMLSIPSLDFRTDPATAAGLFAHSIEAIAPIRGRANQMVLVMLAIQAADAGDARYFDDLLGVRGGRDDPFLKPPFNVRSETPQNDSVYLLATSGGFLQAFMFGLSGLRLDEAGLVGRFPATLPRSLSYLKLQNVASRGGTVDVLVSRDASGRVVRHIVQRARNEASSPSP